MPPRLAKLLAFVVAVAMVAGAFWYRSRGEGGGGGGDGDDGAVRVACISELAEVCRTVLDGDGFEVTVADAAETAARLEDFQGEAPFDVWVTLDPWPEMVDVQRAAAQQPGLFPAQVPRPASAALVTLARPEVGTDARSWERLASRAQAGDNVGVPSHETALGAVVEGQAAVGIEGSSDFGSEVFDELIPVLQGVVDSAPRLPSERQLLRMVALQGSYDAVVGPVFLVNRVARSAEAQRQRLVVIPTLPAARADVVVARVAASSRADQAIVLLTGETGATALRGQGWAVPAGREPTGLPDPDVLVALREEIG